MKILFFGLLVVLMYKYFLTGKQKKYTAYDVQQEEKSAEEMTGVLADCRTHEHLNTYARMLENFKAWYKDTPMGPIDYEALKFKYRQKCEELFPEGLAEENIFVNAKGELLYAC
jgi:hypothetical protein